MAEKALKEDQNFWCSALPEGPRRFECWEIFMPLWQGVAVLTGVWTAQRARAMILPGFASLSCSPRLLKLRLSPPDQFVTPNKSPIGRG